jgi:hypothetical protein
VSLSESSRLIFWLTQGGQLCPLRPSEARCDQVLSTLQRISVCFVEQLIIEQNVMVMVREACCEESRKVVSLLFLSSAVASRRMILGRMKLASWRAELTHNSRSIQHLKSHVRTISKMPSGNYDRNALVNRKIPEMKLAGGLLPDSESKLWKNKNKFAVHGNAISRSSLLVLTHNFLKLIYLYSHRRMRSISPGRRASVT